MQLGDLSGRVVRPGRIARRFYVQDSVVWFLEEEEEWFLFTQIRNPKLAIRPLPFDRTASSLRGRWIIFHVVYSRSGSSSRRKLARNCMLA